MSNLWPRVEPLLARVEKPARYIGMERGSLRPEHRPYQHLLAPRLSRHLRDRAAQPGAPDPLRDPQRTRRRAGRTRLRALGRHDRGDAAGRRCRSSRSTPTTTPASFDVVAFGLAAELVYTNVLECLDLAGVPVRAEDRRPEHPLVDRRRPLRVQPRAHGRLRRRVRDRRRRGGRRRDHRGRVGAWKRSGRTAREGVLRELATIPGVYVPVDVRRSTTTARSSPRSRPRFADVPERVDKRTVADLGEWPYPKQAARAAHRGGARPSQRRGVPRLHARVPLLPGRDDHPAGARAPRRPGPHDGAATACAAPATTRSRSRRCRPPTSPGSTAWSPAS